MYIKRSLCIISLIFFTTASFSQLSFSPGISSGVSVSKISTSLKNYSTYIDKIGVVSDLCGTISFNEVFSIVTGTSFSTVGSEFNQNFGQYSTQNSLTLSYLNIPLLAKVKINTKGVQPFVALGYSFGILMNASNEYSRSLGLTIIDSTSDVTKNYNSTDFGMIYSGGTEFKIKNIVPFIQGGYYLGLTNLEKNQAQYGNSQTKGMLKNRGYIFILGGIRIIL